jgi:hypothetical protein
LGLQLLLLHRLSLRSELYFIALSFRQECVKAQDELVVAAEEALDAGDDTGGIDPEQEKKDAIVSGDLRLIN